MDEFLIEHTTIKRHLYNVHCLFSVKRNGLVPKFAFAVIDMVMGSPFATRAEDK